RFDAGRHEHIVKSLAIEQAASQTPVAIGAITDSLLPVDRHNRYQRARDRSLVDYLVTRDQIPLDAMVLGLPAFACLLLDLLPLLLIDDLAVLQDQAILDVVQRVRLGDAAVVFGDAHMILGMPFAAAAVGVALSAERSLIGEPISELRILLLKLVD